MKSKAIEQLLSETTEIIKKHENRKFNSGELFNILDVSGISTDEVKMCRILAEIINPDGSHCMGNAFLEKFVDLVLNIEMDESELSQAKVYTEYPTNESRRIDRQRLRRIYERIYS